MAESRNNFQNNLTTAQINCPVDLSQLQEQSQGTNLKTQSTSAATNATVPRVQMASLSVKGFLLRQAACQTKTRNDVSSKQQQGPQPRDSFSEREQ